MSRVSNEDRDFCWQQVLNHDPWFRLHHLFAPEGHSDSILALNALIAMLEETLDSSEESLTVTRLQWWRSELAPESAGVSAHPALRALRIAREGRALPAGLTDPLMAQVLLRLQAEPVQDQQALKDFCNRIGRSKIAAHLALSEEENSDDSVQVSCAGTGLASLVEFAIGSKNRSWWFVPLEIQARYQLELNDLNMANAGTHNAIAALAAWAEEWFHEQITDLARLNMEEGGMNRHLAAMCCVHKSRTNRSFQSVLKGENGNPGRWKFSDLIRAWSASRSV